MKKISRVALDDALRVLKKSFGAAFDTRGIAEGSYQAIPTGYDDLDAVATNGARGIFMGGIVEVFGPEGSGKTAFAMEVVAHAQKENFPCVWIDAEAGFSPDLAGIHGIDLKSLVMPDLADIKRTDKTSPVPHAGEILDIAYKTIMTGAFVLVVIDSIAGLSPPRVLDSHYDPTSRGVGEVPRMIGEQINKIHHACKNNACTLLLINQLRAKIGDQWNPEDTPGGKAIKFFADQRFRIDKIGGDKGKVEANFQDTDSGDEYTKVIGHYARLKIIKNKKAPPCDPVEIPVYYMKYEADAAKRVFDCARSMQVITKRGLTYTWKDDNEVVLKEESEPELLAAIRGANLQPRLAQACVVAEKEESNTSKKDPTKVPAGVRNIASTYTPASGSGESLQSDQSVQPEKKKRKPKNLDLE